MGDARADVPASYGLIAVLVGVLITVVTWMYARRPVLKSRALLIAVPVVLALLYLCAPTRWLVHRVYAAMPAGDVLVFDRGQEHQQPGSGEPLLISGENVRIELPVRLHGATEDQESAAEGAMLTLRSADGTSWVSPYLRSIHWIRGGLTQPVGIDIPFTVYQRFATQPVSLEMQVAVARYAFGQAHIVTMPAEGSFDVPSAGKCEPDLESGF